MKCLPITSTNYQKTNPNFKAIRLTGLNWEAVEAANAMNSSQMDFLNMSLILRKRDLLIEKMHGLSGVYYRLFGTKNKFNNELRESDSYYLGFLHCTEVDRLSGDKFKSMIAELDSNRLKDRIVGNPKNNNR